VIVADVLLMCCLLGGEALGERVSLAWCREGQGGCTIQR
jgi:hypothetical protein